MGRRESRTYQIIGRTENLDVIEKFLRHVEYLGNVGASRNLLLRVDGDGSGQIDVRKMSYLDEPGCVEWKKIDNEHYNTKQNLGDGALSGIYDLG